MTQAEKTLLRYQYVMANVSGILGDYQKTNLSWSNQIRMLGQNFERLGSVIGSGFIAWLRPAVVAINSYMDSIIAAVQRVVNALGQIFGWQMIVDTTGDSIVDDTEGIADAYDDATGAAKKFKQQLLGIDELNNLTTNDGGKGSGDDGLLGGLSGGNLIEPGGITFKPIESDIKDLYSLGKKLSDGLRNLLPDDWTEIYEKARGFGTGLADFLNGLIQPSTFSKLGKTIAGTIMTAIVSVKAFATTADWKKWGDSIAEGINGFFAEFDGGELSDTFDSLVQGIFDMFAHAVTRIDWEKVFTSLYDFLSNVDIKTIGITIGTIAILGVGRFAWSQLTDWIAKQLTPVIKALITKISSAFLLVGQLVGGFTLAFAGLFTTVTAFTDMWNNGYNIISALIKDLGIAVTGLGALIVAVALGIPAAVAAPVIGVVALITAAVTSIAIFIHDHWEEIATWTSNMFKSLGEGISKFFTGIVNGILGIVEKLINGVIDAINVVLGAAKGAGDLIGQDWDINLISHVSFNKNVKAPDYSGTVGKFANGGFPDQGSLFVAGETYGQSEWLGDINGRTGVVSGAEITGIADAIYSTSAQEMELLRQQNNYLVGILNKEFGISTNQIGKAAREYAQDYSIRNHGRQAYQF